MRSVSLTLRLASLWFLVFVPFTPAFSQPGYVRPLVHEPVDDGRRVVLKGNTHPLARSRFEVKAAPPNLPLERMLLVLKRSPEQETTLLKLLDDQQDKSSPDYHRWLTPEQFGQRFGPADSDLQAVTSWLQSQGFQVTRVTRGRTMIEFSGIAAQVQAAFHAGIRQYVVQGEAHWANANDPEIPEALAPVVAGIHSLHNFYFKPMSILSDERFSITGSAGAPPQITSQSGAHALVPGDYATLYNINPVYQASIDGTGTTIAVVGRSNFNFQDLSDFRQVFSLPLNQPELIFDGPDPGNLGGSEETEAVLDATWSGAVAPGATVKFVLSAGTDTTDGVVLSELYIIDNNLGDVMTESFGECEAAVTATAAAGLSALSEEAAAQGITFIASSGDTGAAGCDNLGEKLAQGPVSASLPASTAFNIAVGGTLFNENGHNGTYWNTTNDPTTRASAKSYIPENVWNETCTTQCPAGAAPLAAGGGGASAFFAKPSWQAGVAGIPNDSHRDLPDVSLSAAVHDPYILCIEASCQSGSASAVSGTSAAAPSFAGIMALVNQKTGSRQGQANYVLYRLAAAETLSQCNGSKTTGLPASTCIFNDVTVGNNAVPGETGYGTATAQYQSTVGYDLASGLGSVNVANLVNQWTSVSFRPTTATLVLTPTTLTHGTAASATITVKPSSGTGTPTGDVSLLTDLPISEATETLFTLTGGTVSGTADSLPGGVYSVRAHYAGDGTFATSDSAPVPVTVSAEASTTALTVFGFDAAGHTIPFTSQPYGNPAYLRADISGASGNGTATGNVTFTENGASFVNSGSYALDSEATAATAQGLFAIPAGQHLVVANYGGDSSFNSSSSPPTSIMVTKAATTTVVAASDNLAANDFIISATVSTTSGGRGPGGLMNFLSGGIVIDPGGRGATVSGTDGMGNIQSGVFTAANGGAGTEITLPAGQNIITAEYIGDANYAGSTSSAITVNVQPDFAFAAAVSSITINRPGGSGTVMLTVTGQTGYNSTINLSAASCAGLPQESACSFNPASITGSGSTTLTISTAAAHSARLGLSGWWTTTLGATLAGMFLLGGASKRRRGGRLLPVAAIAFLLTTGGCGGGSGGGGGHQDPGTPAGTSTVTVTATGGSIMHTATVTVVVK